MHKLITVFFILLCSCALLSSSVEAKRFGGGTSIGKYRVVRNSPNHNARPTEQKRPNRWLGPLAGLVAGGLLASLFAGNGLGGLLGIILLAGLIIFIWRFLARKSFAPARPQQFAGTHFQSKSDFQASTGSMSDTFAAADFKEAFLRQAKLLFIRLQAAYDSANLSDIREFTTPEVFAEICQQIQERGPQENVTEVVTLNAELLQDSYLDLASVKFSGTIRETQDGAALPFAEVWNFQKTSHAGWLVAGIQQAD